MNYACEIDGCERPAEIIFVLRRVSRPNKYMILCQAHRYHDTFTESYRVEQVVIFTIETGMQLFGNDIVSQVHER